MLYAKEVYDINGALFEVFKNLGPGLLEKVYQEALEIEFQIRNIPYEREKRFNIVYKGQQLKQEYIADFVCYGRIILELKSVSELTDIHRAQVINYLKITGLKLALLQNFNVSSMPAAERIIN
ncbi:MAG: GxxExxY protein [Bacteroidales bacterium]|jgi:GxxExxY protein|nr:GxxExxY protein [Bacteroidales bacterium]